MDRHDFDDLARSFAQNGNRRTLLKRALGGVLGGALVLRAGSAQASTCRILAQSCDLDPDDCCDGLTCVEVPNSSGRTACMAPSSSGTPPPPGGAGGSNSVIRSKRCRDCERRCWLGQKLGAKRNRHRVCRRKCANLCRH
jgi:hypothetical protein